ncbi:hypothetical protein [Aquimarina sp. 2304DJ70-9]|uniref:hypothetical protein n=1 Tax=Aquimarina penaris TaxID=3231044 RepID=UPI0034630394
MNNKENNTIINEEHYRLAPFSYGEDFKQDDVNVTMVSPLLLATGVVHFLHTCTDSRKKEEICKQLKISVDGYVSDRFCIYVEDQTGLLPLAEYLEKKKSKLNAPFYLSEYFDYVSVNTAEAFKFNPAECYKNVISYYHGIPGWPNHKYIKKEYMNLPSWEQKDLCHTFIDYFSTHRIEPDVQKKQRAYDWLLSTRKYKRLLVLGKVFPTTPNSMMLYDKSAKSSKTQYDTPEKVEEKLNSLLEGMIKLIESITLFTGNAPYFGNYNLQSLKDIYNHHKGFTYNIYNPIFKKLSFKGTQLNHFMFLEECRRLADVHLYHETSKEEYTILDNFSRMVNTIFKQIQEITDQAMRRMW